MAGADWLVAKAKSGHEDAFGKLHKRHQLRTYRTALRILRNQQDAEDIRDTPVFANEIGFTHDAQAPSGQATEYA
jgi:hypothetical protein